MPEPVSDHVSVEKLAKLFSLPSWDELEERNHDYVWEAADAARTNALESGYTEAEAEKLAQQAEEEAAAELFRSWHDGVMAVAERYFGEHDLELKPLGKHRTPQEYKVVPETTWNEAAKHVVETINGVGQFEYSSVREFLDSGPYTPRQAVLAHLGWISRWPEVYASKGDPRRIFEGYFR